MCFHLPLPVYLLSFLLSKGERTYDSLYLAKKHRRPKSHYRTAITEIFDGLGEQLANGKSVGIVGFGTFLTRTHKGGRGINFKTKQKMEYKEYRVAALKPGKLLKQAVRRKKGLFSR